MKRLDIRKLSNKYTFKKLRQAPWAIFGLLLVVIVMKFWTIDAIAFTNTSLKYVDKAAQEAYFNQRYRGKPFLLTNTNKISQEVTESSSYIKTSYASKQFPNKIAVEVEEYEAFLVLQTASECAVLSTEGTVLEIKTYDQPQSDEQKSPNSAPDENRHPLQNQVSDVCNAYVRQFHTPLVYAVEVNANQEVGTQVRNIPFDEIYASIKVVNALYPGVAVIRIEHNNSLLKLHLADGHRIVLSLGSDVEIQLKRLILISAEIQKSDLEYEEIDLQYEAPVVR